MYAGCSIFQMIKYKWHHNSCKYQTIFLYDTFLRFIYELLKVFKNFYNGYMYCKQIFCISQISLDAQTKPHILHICCGIKSEFSFSFRKLFLTHIGGDKRKNETEKLSNAIFCTVIFHIIMADFKRR